jgi:hypothetical protein
MSRNERRSISEWQSLIEEQRNSGLSVKMFCRERGLVSKTFYNKRHKLTRVSDSDDRAKPCFVKVQPSPPGVIASSDSVVLQYRSSRLELSNAVSSTWLAELMKALP